MIFALNQGLILKSSFLLAILFPLQVQAQEGILFRGVSSGCLKQGQCSLQELLLVVGNVSQLLLGFTGSILLAMFIYGGFTLLTAGGIPERVDKGKKIIRSAIFGILIVFGAFFLVRFLLFALGVSEEFLPR